LSNEKNSKLIEFIKKHCLNKQVSTEYDFDSELLRRNPNINLDNHQNEFFFKKNLNSFENRVENNSVIFNNTPANINNYIYLQNLKNLNSQLNNPILSHFNDLSSLQNPVSQNISNIASIPVIMNKNIHLINNLNNNLLMNQRLTTNNNDINSLLGQKTLRNNSNVNNCDILINQKENQLRAYNLIIYQNNIINNMLGLFNSLRTSMCNNVPNLFQ